MNVKDLFFCLLRNEFCGTEIKFDSDFSYDAEGLYRLAKAHDLAHIIYDALYRNNILPTDLSCAEKFRQAKLLAVYREVQMTNGIGIVCKVLQESGIKFILLKGAVIRNLYPETWMRTSCDIDVLISENDLQNAMGVLIGAGFTTDGVKEYHDISFFYGNIHLELHFNVFENIPSIDGLLNKIWDYTVDVNGFEYAEQSEYFVFHHLAHMSYHFLAGGCGIRPFIDLWILRDKKFYDEQKLMPLLEDSRLVRFYNGVLELLEIWFEGKGYSNISLMLEQYVLSGGVYGSTKNSHAVNTANNKSRIKYILKLTFLPYDKMCVIYPSLHKRKLLLPFYYIHRIFSKLFGRKSKHTKENLRYILSNDKNKIVSTDNLLQHLGLNIEK